MFGRKKLVPQQQSLPTVVNSNRPRRAGFAILAVTAIAFAASSFAAPPVHAMGDGDRNGYSDMQYYFNPWTPFKIAYRVVSYAVRVPLYVLKAPWEYAKRKQEYENQG